MFVNKFFGSAFRDPSKLPKQDTSELRPTLQFSKYRTYRNWGPSDWQNRTTPNWQNTGTLRIGTL